MSPHPVVVEQRWREARRGHLLHGVQAELRVGTHERALQQGRVALLVAVDLNHPPGTNDQVLRPGSVAARRTMSTWRFQGGGDYVGRLHEFERGDGVVLVLVRLADLQ